MNNVKKLLFGLAALAILCFFTAPVVCAGDIAVNSLDDQWFKLKVKSVGYTSITQDASTDITGKKIFKNKQVYVHFDYNEDYYDCQVYTRMDDSGDWEETDHDPWCGSAMMNKAKKYMILPMYFMVNKDKTDEPKIFPDVFMKFKIKTNKDDEFKSAVVKSVAGTVRFGIWNEDLDEVFFGNCTITGKSVKVKNLPPGLQPD